MALSPPPESNKGRDTSRTLLVLTQVYVPDPASVGQHIHDAAAAMARRGYRVIVYCANRGYDDPSQKYPKREVRDGVIIRRLPLSSFGKASIPLRLLAGTLLIAQATVRGLFVRNLKGILVSTSPPMASIGAVLISRLRGTPITHWVMDMNPDQMIEMGRLTETSFPARVFNALNRMILRRAKRVVALDRFMAERLNRKLPVDDKLEIMPPWPHGEHLDSIEHADNPFRKRHNPDDKFIIMYSGNHGVSTPVTTLLQAALRLQDRNDLLFMFIGGGMGKKEVNDAIEQHHPNNIISLPYQPLDQIRYSLSAADVHVVTMLPQVVGVIHPCKIYGAMQVARPILLFAPDPSHLSELVNAEGIGWRVTEGDVDGAVKVINQIVATPKPTLRAMGQKARQAVDSRLSCRILCERFCNVIEAAMAEPGAAKSAETDGSKQS